MFKKLFLPVGMVLMVALSFILPEIGAWFKHLGLSNTLIVAIFFICGWQIELGGMRLDRKLLLLFVLGAVITLGIAPWGAVGLSKLFRLDALPAAGLIVIAAMPPTLSSGVVMTETAGGNTFLALTVTIVYSFVGVFVLPLMLPWCLGADAGMDIQQLKMLIDLARLVILPSLAGYGLKRLVGRKLPGWGGYIPSVCVILLVWSFFSASNGLLLGYPVRVLLLSGAGSLLLHLTLLAGMWYCGKACRSSLADRKAMIFTGASKTLTIALATLTIIGVADGPALAPCLVFYFVQMLIDSALAGKLCVTISGKGK